MNPQGMITGGWEYIHGAYLLTWLSLASYAIYVYFKHKQSLK